LKTKWIQYESCCDSTQELCALTLRQYVTCMFGQCTQLILINFAAGSFPTERSLPFTACLSDDMYIRHRELLQLQSSDSGCPYTPWFCLISPRSRVREQLKIIQLVNTFFAFYWTRIFITIFTKAWP